ncbi:MAG: hypothetical protein AAF108_01975 [Planctomycetota bacterium]
MDRVSSAANTARHTGEGVQDSPSSSEARAETPKRVGGWRRRLFAKSMSKARCWQVRLAIGLPVLLFLATVIVTVAVPHRVALPVLSRAFGVEIAADRVLLLNSDLDFVAEGLRVRVPGVEGPAGEVARVARVTASYDWTDLFGGSPIDQVTLYGPVVRISQDLDTGDLNIERLPRREGGGTGLPGLPSVRIVDSEAAGSVLVDGASDAVGVGAAIEIGEHRGGTWERLWRVPVWGGLLPTDDPGVLDVRLSGRTDATADRVLSIDGQVGVDGTRLVLENVDLALDPRLVPTRARDTFASFRLDGNVRELVFEQRPGEEALVDVTLDSVGISLPFGPRGRDGVRLVDTSGNLRLIEGRFEGDLRGSAEDVPYRVTFETAEVAGRALASLPFELVARVEGYELPPEPPVVPFLPAAVQVRLDQFSKPTGTINASLMLTRRDGSSRISYGGEIDIRDGRAAYYRFPYEFEGLTGRVVFDDDELTIESLVGRAASGARVRAAGRFAPLDGTASVDLEIAVRDVPLDDRLRAALGDERGPIFDALFSEDGYRRLVEARLARSEGEAGWSPEFEMGGRGGIDILLKRDRGEVSNWTRRFNLSIDEARLVPEWYAAPIVASGVRVALTTERLDVLAGTFESLTGGTGTVAGSLAWGGEGVSGGAGDGLLLKAVGVSAGESMALALEGVGDGAASGIVRALGIEGQTTGSVRVSRNAAGQTLFEITASLDRVTGRSVRDGRALALSPRAGNAVITNDGIDIVLSGTARTGSAESSFETDTTVRWSGPRQGLYEQTVRSDRADVGLAFESLVGIFVPELADQLADIRRRLDPRGAVGVLMRAEGDGDGVSLDLMVDRFEGVSADVSDALVGFPQGAALTGRLACEGTSGTVRFSTRPGDEPVQRLGFDGFASGLTFGAEPLGTVSLDGDLAVIGGDGSDGLSIVAQGLRLGSPLLRALAVRVGGEPIRERIDEFDPRGGFAFDGSVRRADGGVFEPRGEVTFEPLSVARGEGRVAFEAVAGSLWVEPNLFLFDKLSGVTGGAVVGVNGALRYGEGALNAAASGEGMPGDTASEAGMPEATLPETGVPASGLAGDVILSVASEGLPVSLRRLAPTALSRALSTLEFDATGPVVVPGARLQFAAVPDGAVSFRVSGDAVIEDARGRLGVELTRARGTVGFEVATAGSSSEGLPFVGFELTPQLDEITAAGVRITDVRGAVSSQSLGRVEASGITGRAHGGLVAVDAVLDGQRYRMALHAGNVSVAGTLSNLEQQSDPGLPTRPETGATLSGRVTLGGVVEDGASGGVDGSPASGGSLTGRGELSMSGGTVLEMPFTLALLQAGHFQVPLGQTLDDAGVRFHFDERLVTFEEMSLSGGGVSLFGFGTMTIPGLVLDLRFVTRSSGRLPLFSSVAESLRDELVTATVRGKVGEQQIGTEQFGVTRRLFRELFDLPVTAEAVRTEEVRGKVGEQSLDRWRWAKTRRAFEPEPVSASDSGGVGDAGGEG